MADQINMNGLSLEDSQHANGGFGGKPRSAYIPPHLRATMGGPPGPPGPPPGMDGPPPAMMNGHAMNGNAWGPPPGG